MNTSLFSSGFGGLSRARGWAVIPVLIACAALLTPSCGDDDDSATDTDGGGDTGGGAVDLGPLPDGVRCDSTKKLCRLNGAITTSFTLKAGYDYLLEGGVFVGDETRSATLTIEPGVTVFGTTTEKSFLSVTPGSKINAAGTREKPIVFTSAKAVGERKPGDWGGVILNGRASLNRCDTPQNCVVEGEGGTGKYGGDNDDDDSGVMRYVRIEFAGRLIDVDDELNGLALQGVGRKTVLEYIQIHRSKDDGIEFFGGAAQVRYLVLTGIQDDSFDWTDGWKGKAQFVVAQQYPDAANNGIEADNNNSNNDATPRSKPTLSNVTLIGSADSAFSTYGLLLREGTAGNLSNFIVADFAEACLDLENDTTFNVAGTATGLTGELTLSNTILSCKVPYTEQGRREPYAPKAWFELNSGNRLADPQLTAPTVVDGTTPDFRPKAGSPALTGGAAPSDPFFTPVTYVGAFDATDDWMAGWTAFPAN